MNSLIMYWTDLCSAMKTRLHILHYRPPIQLREGNVFIRVCVSSMGMQASPWGETSPGQKAPGQKGPGHRPPPASATEIPQTEILTQKSSIPSPTSADI